MGDHVVSGATETLRRLSGPRFVNSNTPHFGTGTELPGLCQGGKLQRPDLTGVLCNEA